MGNKAFTEFYGIAGGQVRPFRTGEAGQFWIIFEVNTGSTRALQQRVPGLIARCRLIFQRFESATNRKSDEDNLAAATTYLLYRRNGIAKARFDRLLHLRHEHVLRNITRRRRGSEEWDPDLLDRAGQFSTARTLLDHARATFSIDGSEIRWKTWRYQSARAIRDRQAFQQIVEGKLFLLQERDMFFQREGEILTGTLCRRLRMKSPHGFFP